MRTVSLSDIREAFDALEVESQTRESIADWAIELRSEYDTGTLVFEPSSEKTKILDAILWLSGVDLIDIERPYFHTIEDISDYRSKKNI
jgi:hypothetical protein